MLSLLIIFLCSVSPIEFDNFNALANFVSNKFDQL